MPWETYVEAGQKKKSVWEPYVEEAPAQVPAQAQAAPAPQDGYDAYAAAKGAERITSPSAPRGVIPYIKSIPGKVVEGVVGLAKGAANIGPMLAQTAMDVEQNLQNRGVNPLTMTGLDAVRAVSEEAAEPMVRGYAQSWGEMVKDPARFFYEHPDQFIGNVLDAASAGALGVGLANRARAASQILKQRGVVTGAEAKSVLNDVVRGTDVGVDFGAAIPDEARIDFRPTEVRGKVPPEYTPQYKPQEAAPAPAPAPDFALANPEPTPPPFRPEEPYTPDLAAGDPLAQGVLPMPDAAPLFSAVEKAPTPPPVPVEPPSTAPATPASRARMKQLVRSVYGKKKQSSVNFMDAEERGEISFQDRMERGREGARYRSNAGLPPLKDKPSFTKAGEREYWTQRGVDEIVNNVRSGQTTWRKLEKGQRDLLKEHLDQLTIKTLREERGYPADWDTPYVERDVPVVSETGPAPAHVYEPRDEFPPQYAADVAADAAGVAPLSISSGDMGMSLDEFDRMRDSGEVIGSRPVKMAYTAGGEISEILDDIAAPKVDRAMSVIKQYAHSPDKVLGRLPEGQKIYDNLNRADLDKGNWLRREWDKFEAAIKMPSGRVIEGDALDTGVFKARDKQLTIGEVLSLSPEDAAKAGFAPDEIRDLRRYRPEAEKLNKFFSENFDAMLRKYGVTEVGPEKEARIWRLAGAERKNPIGAATYKGLDDAERKVLDLYSRKIQDYMPHIFDRKEMGEYLRQQLAKTDARLKHYKPGDKLYPKLMKEREEMARSLEKIMTGNKGILYEDLPRRVRFRFFEKRTGGKEYGVSAIRAYRTYLAGIGKKIFDEPAIRASLAEYEALPADLKPYAKWYMRDYMGMNRNPFTEAFGAVRSLMWIKTLGFNPRSAVVNLTQRINTVADSNPLDSMRGYTRGYTREGKALFDKSGLGESVPQALWEGSAPPAKDALEAIRNAAGIMFQKAERGNLKHAFLTGVEEATRKGVQGEDALIRAGIAKAQKTQFRYGKVGSPRMLRGPGGVVFQFWSYPIKQLEFLSTIAKENPMKLVAWWGLSEGAKTTAQEFLDTDLSSALGLGINYGELIELFRQIPEGDIKKLWYQSKKIPQGGGVMPYGAGPAVNLVGEIKTALSGINPELDDLLQELEPLAIQRLSQSIKALREGPNEEGKYTVRAGGDALYKERLGDLGKRVSVGRPMVETRESNEIRDIRNRESLYNAIQQRIGELLVDGEIDKANSLSRKYNIPISRSSVDAARKRREMTRTERKKNRPAKARARFEEYIER